MADSLTVDIKASLSWLFEETLQLASVTDAAKLTAERSLTDGVAEGQADKLWHDRRTLTVAAQEDLDLAALETTLFGSIVAIELARVKALLIVNHAEATGEDLLLGGGGVAAAAWSAPLDDDPDAAIAVPAASCLLLQNHISGWAVTPGTSHQLRVANQGTADIEYSIAIVGTSA